MQKVYAVKNKNIGLLHNSASGGAFSALAQWILDKNGVVYGCAWDENMYPHHIGIESADKLGLLQGSKYTQSMAGRVYSDVKNQLVSGRYVLFSGTPCQCAALRSFLAKDYEKLYCSELICHGVPNADMLRSHLDDIENRLKGKITDVKFRDKKLGWGALLNVEYKSAGGKIKNKYYKPDESWYYHYFWNGCFYRESCYACKYAKETRYSDFTLGDYWGAQNYHPEFKCDEGVSVLIANGEKAKNAMGELSGYMQIAETDINKVKRENGQLSAPSEKPIDYDRLFEQYIKLGSALFERQYLKNNRIIVLKGKLKRIVPKKVKDYS